MTSPLAFLQLAHADHLARPVDRALVEDQAVQAELLEKRLAVIASDVLPRALGILPADAAEENRIGEDIRVVLFLVLADAQEFVFDHRPARVLVADGGRARSGGEPFE